jgi:ABC-type nickel/cobalt efflux system permease component RcnA
MDSELLTQVLALLTGAWTLYQEVRHRRNARKAKEIGKTMAEALKAKKL